MVSISLFFSISLFLSLLTMHDCSICESRNKIIFRIINDTNFHVVLFVSFSVNILNSCKDIYVIHIYIYIYIYIHPLFHPSQARAKVSHNMLNSLTEMLGTLGSFIMYLLSKYRQSVIHGLLQ
jgi:hypothetical protein